MKDIFIRFFPSHLLCANESSSSIYLNKITEWCIFYMAVCYWGFNWIFSEIYDFLFKDTNWGLFGSIDSFNVECILLGIHELFGGEIEAKNYGRQLLYKRNIQIGGKDDQKLKMMDELTTFVRKHTEKHTK